MILPSVTVLIPTYARTRTLAEAIYSAQNQDYKGRVQILVVNDCQRQKLLCSPIDPRVQVLNLPYRRPSLGEKRDLMIGMVGTEWVAFLDDDDIWLPWYLSSMLNGVDETTPAVFATHQFYHWEGRWSLGVVPGGMTTIVARTKLAKAVGFDHELNVGEDNVFRQGVERMSGRNLRRVASMAYGYRRDAPGVHISSSFAPDGFTSDNRPWLRHAEERMDKGVEPTGNVLIKPRWHEDYWKTLHAVAPTDIPAPPA